MSVKKEQEILTALGEDGMDDLAEKLVKKLHERKQSHWVESEVHAADHAWVKTRRQDEEETRQFKRKVIQSAVLWAIPLVLTFVSIAIWKEIASAAHKAVGN